MVVLIVKFPALIVSLILAQSIGPAFGGQHGVEAPIDQHALFRAVGAMYQLDPALLESIAEAESGGDIKAVSPAGAIGLMQLMPATAARFHVDDPFDPVQNALGAARFLDLLRRDPNIVDELPELLAAYNAGPGPVERFGGIPPYPETREYVRRVLWLYLMTPAPLDRAGVRPAAIAQSRKTRKLRPGRIRRKDHEVLDQLSELRRQRAAARAIGAEH